MSEQITLEDLDFPKAVLTRVLKQGLPDNISVQKDVRLAVSRASTVFVSYLAATANDCARDSGHKTIMTGDVFKALEAVGLADFIERLKGELEEHKRLVEEKKQESSNQTKETVDEEPKEEPKEDQKEDLKEEPKEESKMDVVED